MIGEAIESFLKQDYQGDKELIIINDFDQQELSCDITNVHVLNSKRRFRSIGEKRNASIALSSGDVIFPWDDDDIHLPNRISHSLNEMRDGFYNPRMAWVINNGIKGPSKNTFHGIGCFTRELFDSVGGYPHINSGQDAGIEKLFESKKPLPKYEIKNNDVYYVYRWSDTDSWHLSACGVDANTGKNGMQLFSEMTQRKIDSGMQKTGKIEITPFWKCDYPAFLKQILDAKQD